MERIMSIVIHLMQNLSQKKRVFEALILRFIIGRHGRGNIGFFWTVMEPMTLCIGVMVIWKFTKGDTQHGLNVVGFVLTGYIPLTLWRHQTGYAINILKFTKFLTIFKGVSLFDTMISRMLLEFISVSAAGIVVQITLSCFGLLDEPYSYATLIQGWIIMGALGTGFGVAMACLSEVTEVVEKVNGPVQYFLLPFCGAFYMVEWLPDSLRQYALYLPMVHAYEMIRDGYFGPSIPTHYDLFYVFSWTVITAGLGCFFFERIRDKIET